METSYQTTLLRLRLAVGLLGERAQHAWWPTSFYDASSRVYLSPVFTRTHRLARYHGVVEAARRVHDEHLNVGSYHLFRLPEEVEQDLHGLMLRQAEAELVDAVVTNTDAALEVLRRFGPADDDPRLGPVAVGRVQDLAAVQTLQVVARAYLTAFVRGVRTYPYLLA